MLAGLRARWLRCLFVSSYAMPSDAVMSCCAYLQISPPSTPQVSKVPQVAKVPQVPKVPQVAEVPQVAQVPQVAKVGRV